MFSSLPLIPIGKKHFHILFFYVRYGLETVLNEPNRELCKFVKKILIQLDHTITNKVS